MPVAPTRFTRRPTHAAAASMFAFPTLMPTRAPAHPLAGLLTGALLTLTWLPHGHAQTTYQPGTAELNASTTVRQLGLAPVLARGIRGQGITIAVLDSGLSLGNPEFFNNARVLPGWNANGSSDITDTSGHGTHVTGILAASANGSGIVGVAPAASILPVKIFNSPTVNGGDLNRGLRYAADAGARVINLSVSAPQATGDSTLRAIAVNDRVLVVAAAGNRGAAQPDWPARYAGESWAEGRILAVGAVDANRRIASFSNRAGDVADFFLVAPGVNVLSSYGNGYATLSGTSMAAPAVSGAAALLWSYWPYLRASQVSAILLNTADDLGAPGVDAVYGHGMLNVSRALSPVGSFTYRAANGRSVSIPLTTRPVGSSPIKVASPAIFRGLTTQVFDQYGRNFTRDEGGALSVRSITTIDSLMGRADTALNTAERLMPDGSRLVTLAARARSAFSRDPEADWNHTQPATASLVHRQSDAGWSFAGGSGGYGSQALGLMDSPLGVALGGLDGAIAHPILGFAPQHRFAAFSAPLADGWRARMGLVQSKTIATREAPQADVTLTELTYARARFALNVSIANLSEQGLLGGYSHAGLGLSQRTSTEATSFSGAWKISEGWTLAGQYTVATTGAPQAAGILAGGTVIRSAGYGLGLLRTDVWRAGDRFSVMLQAPLRARSGRLMYEVVDQVTDDGTPVYRDQVIDLKGTARERLLETRYTLRLGANGWLSFAAAYRQHPDHDADAPAEALVGVRAGLAF